MLSFFPKSPNRNSETAILFNVVEKPNNYVFGDELFPQGLLGGAQIYKLWLVSNSSW